VTTVACALAAPRGWAADTPAATPQLTIHGFVDGVFAYNFNRPADHVSFFPGAGTSAKRDNELAINLAQVDFTLAPEPVGFKLALGFGNAARARGRARSATSGST
jgi:hypothetical protein